MYFEFGFYLDRKVVGCLDGLGQLMGDIMSQNPWYAEIFASDPAIPLKERMLKRIKIDDFAKKPFTGLIFDKNGKFNDIIKFGGSRGFFVNTKLKTLLETCHLPNHKFLQTEIISEKTNKTIDHDYYWFVYDLDTGEETVNFEKSEFEIEKHEEKYGKRFNITNYQEYLNVFYETGSAISPRKLVFNKNFDKELDIFSVHFLTSPQSYISERLLNKWNDAGIVGHKVYSPDEQKRRAAKFNEVYLEMIWE